jgi:hypothetical protein
VGSARSERKAEGGRDARAALNRRDMPGGLRYFQSFSLRLFIFLFRQDWRWSGSFLTADEDESGRLGERLSVN